MVHMVSWSQDGIVDSNYVSRVLEETKKIWDRMKGLHDCSVPMSHDGELLTSV